MLDRYCGTLAVEYQHLFQRDEITWIQERFETRQPLTAEQQANVLKQLLHADAFERFLSEKFPASKR